MQMNEILAQFIIIQTAVAILTIFVWHREINAMYELGQRNWFKLLMVENQLILGLIILGIHTTLLYAGV
jgi:hypothetical protein